jgi:hypothetical protein
MLVKTREQLDYAADQNHINPYVPGTGQGETRHSNYKRLKLGGGQA